MPVPFDAGCIRSLEQAQVLVQHLLEDALPFDIDIETGYDGESRENAAKHPEEAFIAGISLTNSLKWGRYIPLRHDSGPNLDNAGVAELLWPLAQTGLGVAHGGQFELRFLSRWFAKYLGDHPVLGPQVAAAHLGNPAFPGYFPLRSDSMLEMYAEGKLESIALKYATEHTFGIHQMELHELFALQAGKDLTKVQQKCMRFNELDLMGPHYQEIIDYACGDVVYSLAHHLHPEKGRYAALSSPSHPQHFIYRLEMEIQPITCAMEDEGILMDWPLMRENSVKARLFKDKLAAEINDELTEMLRAKGIEEACKVNLGSSPQLGKVLYEQLGMPVPHTTKGGKPSVDKLALDVLKRDFPVVQRIRNHASLAKLDGTYLSKYPDNYSYAPDGRSHPHLFQCGVPAGRFSASEWPYQQSPKIYHYELRTGETFDCNFRDHAKAPDGYYGLGFDLAQMEVRVIAGEAHEQVLLDAFNRGDDLHSVTASRMLGVPLAEVTKEQRALGKTVGLGLGYQLGVEGLADRLGVTVEASQDLYDKYFAGYPALKPYTASIVAQARRDGYLITRFGRRVPVWGYLSDNRRAWAEADRTAGNIPVQGPGTGDYPKIAMVRSDRALKAAGIRHLVHMVMNMHDALEWYVHKSLSPLEVIRVLQPAVIFTLPQIAHWPKLAADWHIWERWGSPVELDVELGDAGEVLAVRPKAKKAAPVAELSGDEEAVPVVAPDVVKDLVGPAERAVAGEQPGVAAGNGSGGSNGAVHRSDERAGPARRLVIDMPVSPSEERARQLVDLVRWRAGCNELVLRTPEGEHVFGMRTSLEPKDQPELDRIIGPCMVTYASDEQ